jgi:prepilin-type N-terminal cleavage/methylation domain-containing protein
MSHAPGGMPTPPFAWACFHRTPHVHATDGVDMPPAAFTLLEMLAVIAVLGLVAGLVVARVDVLSPTVRLRTAARDVAATASWARGESVGRALPLALRYDLAQGEYWIAFADADGLLPDRPEPPRERFRNRTLPGGVQFADIVRAGGRTVRDGVVTIRFTALGGGEGHVVHLADADGNAFTVEVLPLAAQVNIVRGRMEATRAAP